MNINKKPFFYNYLLEKMQNNERSHPVPMMQNNNNVVVIDTTTTKQQSTKQIVITNPHDNILVNKQKDNTSE